jgi:hypothetical protein
MPNLFSLAATVTPAQFFSTIKAVNAFAAF